MCSPLACVPRLIWDGWGGRGGRVFPDCISHPQGQTEGCRIAARSSETGRLDRVSRTGASFCPERAPQKPGAQPANADGGTGGDACLSTIFTAVKIESSHADPLRIYRRVNPAAVQITCNPKHTNRCLLIGCSVLSCWTMSLFPPAGTAALRSSVIGRISSRVSLCVHQYRVSGRRRTGPEAAGANFGSLLRPGSGPGTRQGTGPGPRDAGERYRCTGDAQAKRRQNTSADRAQQDQGGPDRDGEDVRAHTLDVPLVKQVIHTPAWSHF